MHLIYFIKFTSLEELSSRNVSQGHTHGNKFCFLLLHRKLVFLERRQGGTTSLTTHYQPALLSLSPVSAQD